MADYDTRPRSPLPAARASRERDDYRSADPYRDRRRSPERDRRDRRGGGDRRRSRSPTQIDRYEPDRVQRDDYYRSRGPRDDVHRERRRSSPQPPSIDRYVPGQSPPQQQFTFNPMQNPMTMDMQVGFTWFAEWWRLEQKVKEEKERQKTGRPSRVKGERETREDKDAERSKIQVAYDQYKCDLQKQQAQTFVRMHKGEDWFRERYVPEARDAFRRRLMDYRQSLFAQWEQDLSNGVFDEFNLEGIYKSESNGLGGILEKEEGEAPAAAEILGVGDLLPSKGGELRDPAAQQPTLLIKTVAPTVSRESIEAFAKEQLGEGEGGFNHLSLSDPNPLKKCHRMGWILLNSESESASEQVDETSRDHSEDGEADGENKTDGPNRLLSTTEKAVEKVNGKAIEDPERGNFTVHVGVHRPPDAPRKKALWDLFSAPERIARDLELATRLVRKLDNELGDEYFGVAKIEERVQDLAERGMLQPPAKPKPEKDVNMDEDGEEEEDEGMIEEDETDDEELLMKKKKLDFLVEYLRRVYNFCFFCVFESDSVHELHRKCPGGHLRRPRSSLTTTAKEVARASASGDTFPLKKSGGKTDQQKVDGAANLDDAIEDGEMALDGLESPVEDKKSGKQPWTKNVAQFQRAFNWVKTFEEKILQIVEPENVNVKKLGGTPIEEGLEEELSKFVKQEDASKFRCKVPDCSKLFKGVDFWRKHIEKRHAEWYERVRDDLQLVNTYVLDPSHIAPSRSDASSNGHFPANNNVPTGTPRGYQFSQHMQNNFMQAGFPMGVGVPGNAMQPIFPGQMGVPPGFMAAGMMPGLQGGVGPMRNNHRNHMNGMRSGGPYARNDGRRMNSMSGGKSGGAMMMPFGGMPGMVGMGSNGMIGPDEAVQGRSLRSYEDLDAAGDREGKAEEMDY